VTLQAAPGKGIVTSLVLQSDDLDEIDFEWVGGDNAQVQTNYFSKGDTTTYDRGAYHPVANPTGQFHTYSIDWTKERVQWIIDGAVIRTLTYADAKGGATFPQTPMQFKYGTWVAGKKTASEGTVQWSGGYTNFAEAPFDAYYKDIKITDYSNGVKGAKQYVYGDKTGKWESIKVITEGGADTKSSTSSAPASSTTSAPSSKTTLSTSTVSGAATTTSASGTTPTGSRTTTSSGPSSQTSAPGTNAAGHVTFGFGNVAIAGVALLVANLFVL
jgi:beta-glucanase (GH16 family)